MKIGIGLQCRISSKRFPNKIFYELTPNKTVIDYCLQRCKEIKDGLDVDVTIAILVPQLQSQIFEHVADTHKAVIIYGPEDNVLKRYQNFQRLYQLDYIVRLTGDCPLLISEEAIHLIKETIKLKYDYGVMKTPENWFDGTDVEIFTSAVLKKLYDYATLHTSKETFEHVTWPLNNDPEFFAHKLIWPKNEIYQDVPKLSIDTTDDYFRVKQYLKECFWIFPTNN